MNRTSFGGVLLICLLFGGRVWGVDSTTAASMADSASKTLCIGHFLLDVPGNADVRATGSYWAVDVAQQESRDYASLKREVRHMASRLDSVEMQRSETGDRLYRAGGVDPDRLYASTRLVGLDIDLQARTVAIGYHEGVDKAGIVIEVHRLIDGKHYRFSTTNHGADKYLAARDRVMSAADSYAPFDSGEIPMQPGFCVGDGLFREKNECDVGGDATLLVRFPDHPDVTFSIDIHGLVEQPGTTFLERRMSRGLGFLAGISRNVRTLRRGRVRYAGQSGYVTGIGAPDEEVAGGRMQKFVFTAEGVANDPRRPALEVQLITGQSGPSPLTDQETVVLWKRLMDSLRLRDGSI